MVGQNSLGRKTFVIINTVFLVMSAVICLIPIINVLAISLSSSMAAGAGEVYLWPVQFTTKAYEFVLAKTEFWLSFGITIKRVILGTTINMLLSILIAYPLSKQTKDFRLRTPIVWFFVLTMLFSGGLIPTYMIVKNTKLIDSIWSLILPNAVNVFNIILLLNFFRNIPKELEEAAFIDGAGHWTILWKIFIPLSMPAIATLIVFTVVGHWNSWFDGMIYMNNSSNYPLQTYLQTLVVQTNSPIMSRANALLLRVISERTVKSAQIFIATIPVFLLYPFLQKHFMAGIVLGGVKE